MPKTKTKALPLACEPSPLEKLEAEFEATSLRMALRQMDLEGARAAVSALEQKQTHAAQHLSALGTRLDQLRRDRA